MYNYDYSGPHGYFSESINLKVYESDFSDSIVVESLKKEGSSNFNNHVRPDAHFYQGEYFLKNYPLKLSLDGGNDFSNFDLFDGSKLSNGELIYKIYDNSSYFLFQNEKIIYLNFLERDLELKNLNFSPDHDKIISLKNGIIKSYILSSGLLINERNININGSLDLYDDICVVISENELHKFEVGNILSVSDDENLLRIHPNPAYNIIYLNSELDIKCYEMISISGQKIKVEIVNNSIDIRSLHPGIYILSIVDIDGKKYTQKVVVN